MDDEINIVDIEGNRIGSIGKLDAHEKGTLHEAFSIFVFDNDNRLLLQKRNSAKYHSGGLWTNTCCSHPKVDEKLEAAIHRRLQEEMGFDCELKEVFSFTYRTERFTNNLIENEFDHVFIGHVDSVTIKSDPNEVTSHKWITLEDLKNDISISPDKYTEWLKIIMTSGKLDNMV